MKHPDEFLVNTVFKGMWDIYSIKITQGVKDIMDMRKYSNKQISCEERVSLEMKEHDVI